MTATCFTAGSGGQILASVNSGATWTPQSSGIATAINGLSCPSTTFCVAAGDYGVLLRTSNGGSTWSRQTSNNGHFLAGVSCPTTSTCYAAGYAGSIYKSVDGGNTWLAQVSKTTNNLYDISCSSTTFCAAVGFGGVITSTSDGVNWAVPGSPPSPTTQTLEAVSCSGNHCAAVGLRGTIVEFGPGLTSPSLTTAATTFDLYGVNCADATTCYAVGALGTGLFLVWPPASQAGYWLWDGPGPKSDLFAASCPSTTSCVAVGSGGAIATTATSGRAWTAQSSAFDWSQNNITCLSLSLCYVVGGIAVGRSVDQGVTWSSLRTGAQQQLQGISCPTASTCVAVSIGAEVVATRDGGATWTTQVQVQTGTGRQLYNVSCPTVMNCIAVGSPGLVMATTNGGTTWTDKHSGTDTWPFPSTFLTGIACTSISTCEVTGDTGFIMGTTDGGTTWAPQTSGVTRLWSITCPTSVICYAAGEPGKIIKTINGGSTWSTFTYASTAGAAGVSCSTATVCAAVGPYGPGLSTTDGINWAVTAIAGAVGISCPTSDCVTTGGVDFISGVWKPVAGGLNAVSCPTTPACMAVGTGGIVLTTADGGTTWTPRAAGTFVNLLGVSCPAPATCAAVGASGTLLATADGGATWTLRTLSIPCSPQPCISTTTFNAVSCASSTACIAVGIYNSNGINSGIVAYTTNGGATWATPATNPTDGLHGVSCPTTSLCFAAGDKGVYWTADGGATWPGRFVGQYLVSISCISASSCITVGNSQILATSDGGLTWSLRIAAANQALLGVTCPTALVCFVSATGALVLRSVDGGITWSRQFASVFFGLSCATATNCHGVGSGIWATSTGGDGAWTVRRPSGNTNALQGISCPSVTVCYAVGVPGTFLVSNDDSTWVDHSINSDVELYGVSCPTVTTCFAAGWPGVIYATTNSGATWSPQTNPVIGQNVFLFAISCASPITCVAVGTGGTIISTSNGSTWTSEASGTTGVLLGVSCPTSSSCVAVGAQGVTMTRTGGSWQTYPSGTTQHLFGVSCPSTSICYAVGAAGTVLMTQNRGGNWTAQASGIPNGLYGISCPLTTMCLAAGSFGAAVITLDGSSWSGLGAPTANALQGVAFQDVNHALVVGYGGTILAKAACPLVSESVAPPATAVSGTTVTFTASASGCANPLYQFWTLAPGSSTWTIGQAYSTNATFTWNTTGLAAGNYLYTVWVRDATSAGAACRGLGCFDSYSPATAYSLTTTPCTAVTETAAPPSTASSATSVTFTASASGCPHPFYQFWILAPGSTTWTIAQPYSTSATFTWNTSGLVAGAYRYTVWARDSGGATTCGGLGCFDVYAPATAYTLTTTACSLVTESAAPPSTAPAGTSVTFTASASGCTNPLYQFWILAPGSSWTIAQPFSSTTTFTWNTTGLPPGTYTYTVWARDSGSAATCGSLGCFDTYAPATAYALSSTACSAVTESAAPPATAASGTSVTFTASASGCPNPLYQFWILAPGSSTWTIGQPYSSAATFIWNTNGLPAGSYRYTVWVRDVNSSGTCNSLGCFDAYAPATAYTLSATPCTSVTETVNLPMAQPGMPVTFTASASGCANPLYQFWLLAPGSNTWTIMQAYSSTPTFTWDTTGVPRGTYTYTVWVRDVSSAGTSSNSLGTFDAYSPTSSFWVV